MRRRDKKFLKRLEEKAIRKGIMLDEIKCIERFMKQLEGINDQKG